MTRSIRNAAIAIAAICFAFPIAAHSDIPRPKPSDDQAAQDDARKPKINVIKVVIDSGDPGLEAQVWLPPSMIAGYRNDGGAAGATGSGLPPTQTIVAGLAMSLSLVFGGLWLVRTRKKLGARAVTSAAVVMLALAGTAAFALANAGPPRDYKPVDPGTLRLAAPEAAALAGNARYYYGDEGVIRIVIPKPEK